MSVRTVNAFVDLADQRIIVSDDCDLWGGSEVLVACGDLDGLRQFRDFIDAEVRRMERELGHSVAPDEAPDRYSEGFPGGWSKILADVSAVDPEAGTVLLGLMRASVRGEETVFMNPGATRLDALFIWCSSPQGGSYWADVGAKLGARA